MKKRVLAIVLTVCLGSSLIGAFSAVGYAAGGAQGVVDAAKSYLENSVGPDFGGGESDWCGRFLYRCAEDAGESAALCGSVDTMKSTNGAMKWFVQNGCEGGYFYKGINYGNYGMTEGHLRNKDSYTPALGDIIFYDWDGNPSNFGHMEILVSISGRTITTIGGSTGGSCTQKKWNGRYHVHAHTYDISNKFIVGYARPNYGGDTVFTPDETTSSTTKTQYRYHRYVDTAGNVSLCPYYGGSIFHSTMTLQYTDWLDQPLTRNSNPSGHNHVNQGSACTNSGCIDPSRSTERFTDGNSNWYYEETRTVEEEKPTTTTPTPVPPTTPTPVPPTTPMPVPSTTPTPVPPSTPTPAPVPNCDKGHTWEWRETRPAACEEPGLEERVCQVCGKRETRVIEALDHDYYAKQETDTYALYICSNCGDTFVEEKKPETPQWVSNLDRFVDNGSYTVGLFTDVKTTDWFSSNVSAAYGLGLMNGRGHNLFQPDGTLTVAESITLAARIHAVYYGNTIPTYDGGNWYDGAVIYAREHGIPAQAPYEVPATRETFAHTLAAALPAEELWDNGSSVSFADVGQLRYAEEISLLCKAGIINGISRNGSSFFEPTGNVTRAQAAAIITRMVIPGTRLGN